MLNSNHFIPQTTSKFSDTLGAKSMWYYWLLYSVIFINWQEMRWLCFFVRSSWSNIVFLLNISNVTLFWEQNQRNLSCWEKCFMYNITAYYPKTNWACQTSWLRFYFYKISFCSKTELYYIGCVLSEYCGQKLLLFFPSG